MESLTAVCKHLSLWPRLGVVFAHHQGNFSLQETENISEDLSQPKWRGAQPQWVHLQNTPTPKAQGTLQKKEQKDCESWRIRLFAVRLCLLVTSDATSIKSH